MRAVIVKTGSTMPHLASRRGDYEDWIADGMGVRDAIVCHVAEGAELPALGAVDAIVVTGSSAMVTDREPWSVRTGEWLGEAVTRGKPTLGICYGHQLMAATLGGEVGPNARGREIGQVEVTLTEAGRADPLLSALPSPARVSSSHRQCVVRLPDGAVLLAEGAAERHQAFRVGERAWGVQFHPEWDAEVIRAYVESRRETLRGEGLDPDRIEREIEANDNGPILLRRFAELAR
ncbi:MAG: glutamine amidotransferase [Sandaracinaceae bacterium]